MINDFDDDNVGCQTKLCELFICLEEAMTKMFYQDQDVFWGDQDVKQNSMMTVTPKVKR